MKAMVPNVLLAGVLLLNFAVFHSGNLKLSALHLLFAITVGYVMLRTRKLELGKAVTMLFLLALPLLNVYFVEARTEFFKTFMTYTILVFSYFMVLPYLQRPSMTPFNSFYRRLLILVAVLQVFGIVQWVTANFFHSMSLFNLYLPFQFNDEQLVGAYRGLTRADSIFPEPSIFAIVCNLSSALILAFGRLRKDWFFFALNVVAMSLTFSSSAYLFFLLMLAAYLLLHRKYGWLAYGLGFLSIALLLYNGNVLQIFRFNELYSPGTSGYYRVVSPLLMLKDVLLHHPLNGIGIGQIDLLIPQDYAHYFIKSGTVGRTLDNSLMLSFIVFGFPVLFVYYRIVTKYVRRYAKPRLNIVLMLYLVSFLNSTGLLFAPEFILILLICEWAMYQNAVEAGAVPVERSKEEEGLSYPNRLLPSLRLPTIAEKS